MNRAKKKLQGKKGFTLMEMLIVVAIIAILIAILIPTFSNALDEARIAADTANVRAYYAELMVDYMLEDAALPAAGEVDEATMGFSFQMDGAKVTADGDNIDTFTLTYIPGNGYDTVTIPATYVAP